MDDRLIAQVNATATSLREAARAADDELRAEEQERDAIDARIEQLQALKRQLEEAIAQAESTLEAGTGSAGTKAARKRSTTKKATRKRATAKKATRRKSARKRSSSPNGVGRQDAVLQVLSRADGPMRPAEVAEQLRATGRGDSSSQVSAALAQLARSGRATKVEQGLYAKGGSS